MNKEEIRLHRLTGKSIRCCRFALRYNRGNIRRAYNMLTDDDQEADRR